MHACVVCAAAAFCSQRRRRKGSPKLVQRAPLVPVSRPGGRAGLQAVCVKHIVFSSTWRLACAGQPGAAAAAASQPALIAAAAAAAMVRASFCCSNRICECERRRNRQQQHESGNETRRNRTKRNLLAARLEQVARRNGSSCTHLHSRRRPANCADFSPTDNGSFHSFLSRRS